jgi:hypothetical protein
VTEPSAHLALARAALESGNFREVRRLVGPLLSTLPSGPERQEAEELWSRIQPDPWMSYLLVLSLLLLLAVTAFAYSSSAP